ncbi:hypothetical protein NDU88_002015 [Pleurodeles waltl]|uniref:Uncharacterized protein n=1 Tax=Pleurodeles waltl TaxID=8319 RepID=A0AAV7MPA7_PLEWA|nr:hypothetical protein NDU88_002015 [Pleurodeles waltl]
MTSLQTPHPLESAPHLLRLSVHCLCRSSQEGRMPKNRALCYEEEHDPRTKAVGMRLMAVVASIKKHDLQTKNPPKVIAALKMAGPI